MNLRLHTAVPTLLLAAALIPASAQFDLHSAPMQVINGKPYVEVFINHKGPFRFLIDTGTSADALIMPALAEELHLPQDGTLLLHDPTGLPGPTVPVRLINTLTVAGVDLYAIRAPEHALLPTDVPFDGLLGFKLFNGFLLTLNYPAGRFTLAEGELTPDGGRTVHPFHTHDGLPYITLTIGDLPIDTLLDSGGSGLSIPDSYAKQFGIGADTNLMGTERTLAAIFPFRVAKLPTNVELGDVGFDKPWVEINSEFQFANLGSQALQYFSITFDQDNNLVRFEGPRKRISLDITPSPLDFQGTTLLFAAPPSAAISVQ
ncbi:MAG: aspartyl protease family protein [Acidobacteriota bacterium]